MIYLHIWINTTVCQTSAPYQLVPDDMQNQITKSINYQDGVHTIQFNLLDVTRMYINFIVLMEKWLNQTSYHPGTNYYSERPFANSKKSIYFFILVIF